MTSTRLDGKRVLLTQSNDFMGPALAEVFTDSGAEVVADPRPLDQDPALPAALVREAGRIDVLLIHLALPAPSTPAADIGDAGGPCSRTWSTRCPGSWPPCCRR